MKNCIVKIANGVPVVFGETGKDDMDSPVYVFEEEEEFNNALNAGKIPVGTLIVKAYEEEETAVGQSFEIQKPWEKIFYTDSLKETGTIEQFKNYNEYLILLGAGEYLNTHYVPRIVLETDKEREFIFSTSYFHSSDSHKMSTFSVNSGGEYSVGRGLPQNSSASTVTIYAK